MLGDRYKLEINIKEKKYSLEFTFQAIKNLYQSSGKSIFKWIKEFGEAKDKRIYIYQIIFAMTDARISIDELECLFEDEDIEKEINNTVTASIYSDIAVENIDIKQRKSKDEEDVYSNETFEKWWNYMYYVATIKLGKSDKWFYKATPRIVKSLNSLRLEDEKNILISAYIEVIEARNNAKEKEDTEEVVEIDEYTSFSSIFGI